jgi:type II secretory pathway component PulK
MRSAARLVARRNTTEPRSRGFALLIALALVVGIAAVVTPAIMLRAQTDNTSATLSDRLAALALAIDGGEPMALEWLHTAADDLVLPPDVAEPSLRIAASEWAQGGRPFRLTVDVWDVFGLSPDVADRGPDPPEVGREFGRLVRQRPARVLRRNASTAGAALRVNPATAPRSVLQTVLPPASADRLEQIADARRAGNLPQLGSIRLEGADERSVVLTSPSPAWIAVIEARVGSERVVLWVAFMHDGNAWRIAERRLLDVAREGRTG